jgi:hypothetical protein
MITLEMLAHEKIEFGEVGIGSNQRFALDGTLGEAVSV